MVAKNYYYKNSLAKLILFSVVLFGATTAFSQDSTATGSTMGRMDLPTPPSIQDLYIYDPITERYILTRTLGEFNISYPIILTPEEWVRQNLIHYLITHLNYPKALIKVETGLKYDKRNKRSDVIVYDRSGNIIQLIECKDIPIKVGQDTLDQVSAYNHVLKAQYIMVTNGKHYLVYATNHDNKEYHLHDGIPAFPEV